MNTKRTIQLLVVFFGAIIFAASANAQVRASATVSVKVVAAPGFSFERTSKLSDQRSVASAVSTPDGGIILHSGSSLMVEIDSNNRSSRLNLQNGEAKTLAATDLRNVTEVKVVYLGS